jgi:glycosyltransferase involved in cell wall biosynthesis
MRERLLKLLYKFAPFDLKGDCIVPPPSKGVKISCLINFYGRLDLLSGILHSLAQQKFPKDAFEVILVEDRGGTDAGRMLAETFTDRLQIRYAPLDKNFGLMGYSRNYALSLSKGEYILFLDDDTVILQYNFLQVLYDSFENDLEIDAIIPHGMASYTLIAGKYGYHEPYFMTSRCTAYRRIVLAELGGFMSHFVGQEDVEFVVRFYMALKKVVKNPLLEYHHPPLLVPSFRKPKAVGYSFYGLKSKYPFIVWLLVILNCARHAPLYMVPVRRFREMGRFGIGFLAGVIAGSSGRTAHSYT